MLAKVAENSKTMFVNVRDEQHRRNRSCMIMWIKSLICWGMNHNRRQVDDMMIGLLIVPWAISAGNDTFLYLTWTIGWTNTSNWISGKITSGSSTFESGCGLVNTPRRIPKQGISPAGVRQCVAECRWVLNYKHLLMSPIATWLSCLAFEDAWFGSPGCQAQAPAPIPNGWERRKQKRPSFSQKSTVVFSIIVRDENWVSLVDDKDDGRRKSSYILAFLLKNIGYIGIYVSSLSMAKPL